MTDRHDMDTGDLLRSAGSAQPASHDAESGYDDGLVHDHGWACRERGAPAY